VVNCAQHYIEGWGYTSEARVAPRSPPYPNADAVVKMVVDAKVSICKELGATHVVNSYCTSLLGKLTSCVYPN
jgi:hypothetical protein